MTQDRINDKLSIVNENRKAALYRWIKIGGILSFIPFVLVAGPLAGHFAGSYLEHKFHFPFYTSFVLITIGFIGSVMETVRIIQVALKKESEQGTL